MDFVHPPHNWWDSSEWCGGECVDNFYPNSFFFLIGSSSVQSYDLELEDKLHKIAQPVRTTCKSVDMGQWRKRRFLMQVPLKLFGEETMAER